MQASDYSGVGPQDRDSIFVFEQGEYVPRARFDAVVVERDLAAQDADRRSCQGGWRLAQERAVDLINARLVVTRLAAALEAVLDECPPSRAAVEAMELLAEIRG